MHMNPKLKRIIPGIIFLLSLIFFILGVLNPIMGTSIMMGIKREDVYILGSMKYFIDNGDVFIGGLLLTFTFIFPVLKYLFIASQLAGIRMKGGKVAAIVLELINKWAMLDVFVVALIIVNMKFDALLVHSSLKIGATYFAISVLLLMIASFLTKRWLVKPSIE